MDERVLILAPFGRDSTMLTSVLGHVAIETLACDSMEHLCTEVEMGAGALLLTEEGLTPSSITLILSTLDRQPAWSDLPIAVLLSGGPVSKGRANAVVGGLGARTNVTYVERPARQTTLASIVASMLRSRRRQYEARDLIRAHADAEARESEARASAEAAIAMRDEFLGIASHELRTPLTVVLGYAQRLARAARAGNLDPLSVEPQLNEVLVHAQRLNALVDDLLDTSRVQQGRMLLEPSLVNLNDLATVIVDRFQRNWAEIDKYQLSVRAGERIVGIWDESRLDQVLTNLVSNALKYSPEGGPITVTLATCGDRVRICVADCGLGIPEDRITDLFQPFSRVHTEGRVVDGTGLGLYIAAQLIERHQGTISVTSRPGEGTTFAIDLPLRVEVEALGDSRMSA